MKTFFKLTLLSGVLCLFSACEKIEIKPSHLDFPEEGRGCAGDFSMYKINDNGRVILYVHAPMDSMSFMVGVGELFDLSLESHLTVKLVKFDKSWNRFSYCTDVVYGNEPSQINTYYAVEGFATITQETEFDDDDQYSMSAELENVIFRDEMGNELEIKSQSFQPIRQGYTIP